MVSHMMTYSSNDVKERNDIFSIRLIGVVESVESTQFSPDNKMQQPKEQSIRRKLGSILGIGASRTTPTPQRSLEDLSQLEQSKFFSADVLRVK